MFYNQGQERVGRIQEQNVNFSQNFQVYHVPKFSQNIHTCTSSIQRRKTIYV